MFSKIELAEYLLYMYKEFIREDWTLLKKYAVYIIKPFWFIRSIIVILVIISTFIITYPLYYYVKRLILSL